MQVLLTNSDIFLIVLRSPSFLWLKPSSIRIVGRGSSQQSVISLTWAEIQKPSAESIPRTLFVSFRACQSRWLSKLNHWSRIDKRLDQLTGPFRKELTQILFHIKRVKSMEYGKDFWGKGIEENVFVFERDLNEALEEQILTGVLYWGEKNLSWCIQFIFFYQVTSNKYIYYIYNAIHISIKNVGIEKLTIWKKEIWGGWMKTFGSA